MIQFGINKMISRLEKQAYIRIAVRETGSSLGINGPLMPTITVSKHYRTERVQGALNWASLCRKNYSKCNFSQFGMIQFDIKSNGA